MNWEALIVFGIFILIAVVAGLIAKDPLGKELLEKERKRHN